MARRRRRARPLWSGLEASPQLGGTLRHRTPDSRIWVSYEMTQGENGDDLMSDGR